MKKISRHLLRSLMGAAGLLTFTACYGPAMPPPDGLDVYPEPQEKVSEDIQQAPELVEENVENEPVQPES